MPPKTPAPDLDKFGRFRSSSSGLLVPTAYQNAPLASRALHIDRAISPKGLSQGMMLDRDQMTLAVKFPRKGSGYDDLVSQAIADGNVANAGASPVIAPQISGMVKRQQNQAMSATIDLTGKLTPTKKARDAIAMFDDSPLGVSDALELMVYRLCTYNRGSPIATVPIIYDLETWDQYGMIAHPILGKRQKEENATRFWLEVDWSKFGQPVPFLPHPFDLEATGNAEYPYWYRATRADGKQRAWVLLHSSQIVPVVPGKSAKPGIGLSPVWMCLGYLAEQILITDERLEKMMYSLTDGIILIGGVSEINPQEIKDQIAIGREEAFERGYSVAKGTTIIASPVDQVSSATISLREPPGMQFKEWREWCEDVIAFCFGEPLSAMVSRGGVGYGAHSETASDNASETGIGAHLGRVGAALGAIYPRVIVSVSRVNDRAARMNINTLKTFSAAAHTLITDGVISATQANRIIDASIMQLPEDNDVTTSANAEDSEDDLGAQDNTQAASPDAAPATTKPASTKPPDAKAAPQKASAVTPDQERMRRYATLIEQGDVLITDADADKAYAVARSRVNEDVYQLLIAVPVEA